MRPRRTGDRSGPSHFEDYRHDERPALRLLVAHDGLSGLAIAREHQPDLVLLDLNLPDIDGLEVFARLRRHPRTALRGRCRGASRAAR